MGKLTMEDVFRVVSKPLPDFDVKPGKTALLLIDFQELVSSKPLLREAVQAGLPEGEVREALRGYDANVKKAVGNARRVLRACREKGYDVVHVRLGAQTSDPRHTAKVNRKAGLIVPMNAERGRFLGSVKPVKGELVFAKTNGGAFTGTNLDFVLRNMDVDGLIMMGFLTDQCVLATALCGADIGYDVVLVEDACAGTTRENHDAVIRLGGDAFFKVKSTSELLRML